MPSRSSADQARLSIINEDADVVNTLPPSPPTASHRPFARRWRDKPPAANHDLSPPKYSVWDVSGPRGEKLMDMRNNKYIVRRGGWKRLCAVFFLIAALSIGLGVGLGVGLRKRNNNQITENATSSSNPDASEQFPIGSYSLDTKLVRMSTGCTQNPDTWRCYPYTLYHQSSIQSNATFQWIIDGPLSNLRISSSDNPFEVTFENVSLQLRDEKTDNEHYFFSTLVDRREFSQVSLTGDGRTSLCYFNGTEFTASLYTRKQPDPLIESTGNGTSVQNSTMMRDWPGAINVTQSIRGGENVPECYSLDNGRPTLQVTTGLQPQPNDRLCTCGWQNYDLEGIN